MELQYNNYAATPVVKTNLMPITKGILPGIVESAYYKPFVNEPKVNLTPEQEKHLLDGISKSLEKDPRGMPLNQPGAKADAGKNRMWLFLAGFSRALEKTAEVTTVGAKKYSPNGWTEVPDGYERYMDAFGRHLAAYGKGEKLDDGPNGTGCDHLSQMIWNLLAAYELSLREAEKK